MRLSENELEGAHWNRHDRTAHKPYGPVQGRAFDPAALRIATRGGPSYAARTTARRVRSIRLAQDFDAVMERWPMPFRNGAALVRREDSALRASRRRSVAGQYGFR